MLNARLLCRCVSQQQTIRKLEHHIKALKSSLARSINDLARARHEIVALHAAFDEVEHDRNWYALRAQVTPAICRVVIDIAEELRNCRQDLTLTLVHTSLLTDWSDRLINAYENSKGIEL